MTTVADSQSLARKEARLRELIAGYGSMAVAFSGGVDSSFLAAFGQEVLGDRLLLLTIVSPSYPVSETDAAQEFARQRGMRWRGVAAHELDNEAYVRNPSDRCFTCKTEMYSRMLPLLAAENVAVLADGANVDDLGDYRPGMQAAAKLGVRHPLQDAGLNKEEIRALSRQRQLPTSDKPAMACLASRFPYGERLSREKLQRVELAEAALQARGFRVYRVRSHERLARLEIGTAELERAFAMRHELVGALKELGYLYVTLDLEGFRSGSMNAALPAAARTAALGGSGKTL